MKSQNELPSTAPLRIDFVSDVSCPWCAIGLQSLLQAIGRIDGTSVDLHFQPFELNPQMPPEGQDAVEHLTGKYGITAEQAAQSGEAIRARGAQLGFVFDMDQRRRVYNTFDAHRLLHWAELQGQTQQLALKQALLRAYFSEGRDVSSHEVLAQAAEEAGLDITRARRILASDEYADEVRAQERFYASQGIRAVPSVILGRRLLVQGGQPVETFERALRQAAAQARAT